MFAQLWWVAALAQLTVAVGASAVAGLLSKYLDSLRVGRWKEWPHWQYKAALHCLHWKHYCNHFHLSCLFYSHYCYPQVVASTSQFLVQEEQV